MADDQFEQDDLWDERSMPRPSGMRPEIEAPDLPEPDLTPGDVGGLDPAVETQPSLPPPGLLPSGESQQDLPQPDMLTPLPGHESAPFPGDAPQAGGQEGGGGLQELVAIGERIAEAVEGITDKMDDLIEKLEGAMGYGE